MPPKAQKLLQTTPPIQEIDKAFYELQISDLNNKLARLRGTNNELETKYLDTQAALEKLDEDRADVISYLKRSLTGSTKEIEILQERILRMEAERDSEVQVYIDKMKKVEKEYKVMHTELSSENKLLMGKMGSLEEYRAQREDLMKKYDAQELRIEEQEAKHKKILYESERKFVLGKDTLKKEMEARLLQLSTDFQEATEMRIAATTQRVIRENIAVNNELDLFLETLNRLERENQKLTQQCRNYRQESELHENETKIALSKTRTQLRIIDRLSLEHKEMLERLHLLQNMQQQVIDVRRRNAFTEEQLNKTILDIRILEQHLHAARSEKIDFETELGNAKVEIDRLFDIIYDASMILREHIKKKYYKTDIDVKDHKELLKSIVTLLDRSEKELPARVASLETIASIGQTYRKGDLGYIPLPVKLPHKYIRNTDIKATQVTPSLELMPPFVRTVIPEPDTESVLSRGVSTEIPTLEEIEDEYSLSISESSSSSEEGSLPFAMLEENKVQVKEEAEELVEFEIELEDELQEEVTPVLPLSEADDLNPPATLDS